MLSAERVRPEPRALPDAESPPASAGRKALMAILARRRQLPRPQKNRAHIAAPAVQKSLKATGGLGYLDRAFLLGYILTRALFVYTSLTAPNRPESLPSP